MHDNWCFTYTFYNSNKFKKKNIQIENKAKKLDLLLENLNKVLKNQEKN